MGGHRRRCLSVRTAMTHTAVFGHQCATSGPRTKNHVQGVSSSTCTTVCRSNGNARPSLPHGEIAAREDYSIELRGIEWIPDVKCAECAGSLRDPRGRPLQCAQSREEREKHNRSFLGAARHRNRATRIRVTPPRPIRQYEAARTSKRVVKSPFTACHQTLAKPIALQRVS